MRRTNPNDQATRRFVRLPRRGRSCRRTVLRIVWGAEHPVPGRAGRVNRSTWPVPAVRTDRPFPRGAASAALAARRSPKPRPRRVRQRSSGNPRARCTIPMVRPPPTCAPAPARTLASNGDKNETTSHLHSRRNRGPGAAALRLLNGRGVACAPDHRGIHDHHLNGQCRRAGADDLAKAVLRWWWLDHGSAIQRQRLRRFVCGCRFIHHRNRVTDRKQRPDGGRHPHLGSSRAGVGGR